MFDSILVNRQKVIAITPSWLVKPTLKFRKSPSQSIKVVILIRTVWRIYLKMYKVSMRALAEKVIEVAFYLI